MEVKPTTELDEDAMRTLVTRLGRPHRSGGRVIERATLLASGTDFEAAVRWIEAHGGTPEVAVASSHRGLHGPRMSDGPPPAPLRFVLPPGA
jgi:hypothetical protein